MPKRCVFAPRAALDFRSVPEIRMTSESKQPPGRGRVALTLDSGRFVYPSFSRGHVQGHHKSVTSQYPCIPYTYSFFYSYGDLTPPAPVRFVRAGGDHVSLASPPPGRSATGRLRLFEEAAELPYDVDVPVVFVCLVETW